MGKVAAMKIIALVASAVAVATIAITVVVTVSGPDNSKSMEMQRKDIAAERQAIHDFQKTHPNPFKAE
jgi:hypothetical protein